MRPLMASGPGPWNLRTDCSRRGGRGEEHPSGAAAARRRVAGCPQAWLRQPAHPPAAAQRRGCRRRWGWPSRGQWRSGCPCPPAWNTPSAGPCRSPVGEYRKCAVGLGSPQDSLHKALEAGGWGLTQQVAALASVPQQAQAFCDESSTAITLIESFDASYTTCTEKTGRGVGEGLPQPIKVEHRQAHSRSVLQKSLKACKRHAFCHRSPTSYTSPSTLRTARPPFESMRVRLVILSARVLLGAAAVLVEAAARTESIRGRTASIVMGAKPLSSFWNVGGRARWRSSPPAAQHAPQQG
jgi:hypothetical protein